MAYDAIVVGAGGGGPVVAKELAGKGLNVLLLEAGPFYSNPDEQWTHLENDANNPLTGYFRFGPEDRSQPAWYRETPQNSFLWQLSGVGGTTLHYYGNCPRSAPGVFSGYGGADAARYDTAHLFPLTYADLVPYYEWVEATLPVQTAAMGVKEHTLFEGCLQHGLTQNTTKNIGTIPQFRPQENAILQPSGNAALVTETQGNVNQLAFPKATGCTMCGYCFQGCKESVGAPLNLKAKRTTLVSYVPMALTADAWTGGVGKPVTLVPNAFATNIITANGGTQAQGVTWRDTNTGETFSETAKVVVLAGGCTETPRLWLNSGLPNPNGWVGQGYTDHFFDFIVGVFPFKTNSSRGVGSSARVDFPGFGGLEQVGLPPALQAFTMLFSESGIAGQYTNGGGMTGPWDGPAGRITGPLFKRLMSNIDNLMNLLVLTDDDVQSVNNVTLSALNADDNGPVAKVSFPPGQRTARTIANREFLANQATQIMFASGATEVYRLDWAPLILHVQSTMRMGLSAADSVLDEWAQSRWVQGLYVADNSMLANSLGGSNPTVTTQALATRTAEHIYTTVFGGEAYVQSTAPVVSTDDRITNTIGSRLG
jgi:choline dehydrogenase-like flavoprotein